MRNIYYILYIVYLKFELKSVTVNIVKKLMQKMQNKKSAGADEISQECLLIGKVYLPNL